MTVGPRRRAAAPGGPGAAALHVLLSPSARPARALLALPVGWLSSSTSARSCVLLLSAFWDTDPFTRRDRPRVHARELPAIIESRSTATSRGARSRWPARDRRGRRPRLPDRVLHGAGRLAADPRPARRRDPHAALGELPRQGYAWRTILSDGGVINWALEPFGLSFDGYSTVGSGSSSPTSGCRS